MLNLSPFDFLTKEGADKFVQRLAIMKKGGYVQDSTDYEVRRKDGSSLWIMITAQFIEDDNGNIIRANVVAIDITKQKNAEFALKRKEEEVYSSLSQRINQWKEEMQVKSIERDKQISLLNTEVRSIASPDEVSYK